MESPIQIRSVSHQLLHAATGGASLNSLERDVEAIESLIGDSREASETVRDVFLCAAEVYRTSRELGALVSRCQIEAQASIARLRMLVPIVEPQIIGLSTRIDTVLDRAGAIDPLACSSSELEYRASLLRIADAQSQQLHQLLMRLMSI